MIDKKTEDPVTVARTNATISWTKTRGNEREVVLSDYAWQQFQGALPDPKIASDAAELVHLLEGIES